MQQQRRRGNGRVSGSSFVNGRGHSNQRRDRRGRGGRGIPASGTVLPNPSTRAKLLALGLTLAGFDRDRQNVREDLCIRRFRAHYGIGPKALRALIRDMKQYQADKPVDKTSLFMALLWLRNYEIEELMAGRWGRGEQYCRETSQEYASRIQALKPIKISFSNMSPTTEFAPVDTVHIRTHEMRCSPSSKWWSHKSNGAAAAFEAVSCPVTGKICWTNGPEPPTTHDLTFLRGGNAGERSKWKKTALYFNIPPNVRLVGDSAYVGQPDKVSTTKDAHSKQAKQLFGRMKSMQETVFKRLKDFKVLGETFRHGRGTQDKLEKLKMVFEATAVLMEYDIEYEGGLFEI